MQTVFEATNQLIIIMQIVVYTHLAYVRIESNNVNTQIPTTGSLMDPQA